MQGKQRRPATTGTRAIRLAALVTLIATPAFTAPEAFGRATIGGSTAAAAAQPQRDWNDERGQRGRGPLMSVPADGRWVDTGLRVEQGEPVNFNTRGTVSLRGDGYDAGPAGVGDGHRARRSQVPDVPVGALIGRIDNGRPFAIGDQPTVNMPDSGRLFLAVNDDETGDNSGEFRVRVFSRRSGGYGQNDDRGWRDRDRTDDSRWGDRDGRWREVTVPATERWVDTGIDVRAGERLQFEANGRVSLRGNGELEATPAGTREGERTRRAPMPDVLAGALIGRVGNGRPFGIGNQSSVDMPGSGRLYLAVNDGAIRDNAGAFRVRIAATENMAYRPRR